jgi:hypothetical protein
MHCDLFWEKANLTRTFWCTSGFTGTKNILTQYKQYNYGNIILDVTSNDATGCITKICLVSVFGDQYETTNSVNTLPHTQAF